MKPIKKLVAVIGKYTDKDGNEKNRYLTVGTLFEGEKGLTVKLDAIPVESKGWFNCYDLDDKKAAEWALIENLQREDLNPIEQAIAFQNLLQQFQISHEGIAERVGVDRSTITNSLRLLNLSTSVQQLVIDNLLSASQAKVLAGIPDPARQKALAGQAIRKAWSVRKLEEVKVNNKG